MFFKKKKVSFKKENPENIIDELIKLGKLAKEKEEFKELLLQEFSCIRHCIKEYHYTYFNYDISLVNFEINIGNITYGFQEEKDKHVFIYIKVKDIVIYHNTKENCNSGLFEGVKSGWNHNSPEKLLEQISNDITIFRKALEDIENNTLCVCVDDIHIRKYDPQKDTKERLCRAYLSLNIFGNIIKKDSWCPCYEIGLNRDFWRC